MLVTVADNLKSANPICRVLVDGVDVTTSCNAVDEEEGMVRLMERDAKGNLVIDKEGVVQHWRKCNTLRVERKNP